MKRLIRKSELVDEKKCTDGGMTKLYKNPTKEEINDALKDGYDSIRGLISNGEVYCWKGTSMHQFAGEAFGLDILAAGNLRFAFDDLDGWIFDAGGNKTLKETIEMVKSNQGKLANFGDSNFVVEFYNTSDYDNLDFTKIEFHDDEYDMVQFGNFSEAFEFLNN